MEPDNISDEQQSTTDKLFLVEFQEACAHYRQVEKSRERYILFFFAQSLAYFWFCIILLKNFNNIIERHWLITGVLSLTCFVFCTDLFFLVSVKKMRVLLQQYVTFCQQLRKKICHGNTNEIGGFGPFKNKRPVYNQELILYVMGIFCSVLFLVQVLGIVFLTADLTLVQSAIVYGSFFCMCLTPLFLIKKHPTALQGVSNTDPGTKANKTPPKQQTDETGCFFVSSRSEKLLEAFNTGDTAAVKTLLDKGANVNAATNDGLSLLIRATKKSDVDMVTFLLDNGADVHIKDKTGWTALIWAAMLGYPNAGTEGGSENNKDFNDSETALFMAEMYRAPTGNALNAQHEIVRLLLDAGSDVNAKGNDGKTALIIAAIKGDTTIVEMLLDKGVEINDTDEEGSTALMFAVANGYKQTVKVLLNNKADGRARSKKGGTAWLYAKNKGNAEIIKLVEKALKGDSPK